MTRWPLSYFISVHLKGAEEEDCRWLHRLTCDTNITRNTVFAGCSTTFMQRSPLHCTTSAVLLPYAQKSVSCSVKEPFPVSFISQGKPSSFLFTPGKWLGARVHCVRGKTHTETHTHTHTQNGGKYKYENLSFKGKYAPEEVCLQQPNSQFITSSY